MRFATSSSPLGSDWTKGIMQGIARCRVFVLVFTDHANDSAKICKGSGSDRASGSDPAIEKRSLNHEHSAPELVIPILFVNHRAERCMFVFVSQISQKRRIEFNFVTDAAFKYPITKNGNLEAGNNGG
jgi:hypothetical protein